MNPSIQERLKKVTLLILIVLVIGLLYTTLHEGGHALAGMAFGGRVTDFNVNFFNVGAHMGIDGHFSTSQTAVFNAAGTVLPLLAWFLAMLLLPKRSGFILQWIKILSTMLFLNTLLAWIIVPFLYLSNSAPPADDVTHFITNSGFPPLAVALAALLIYGVGWTVFALRINDLKKAFKSLSSGSISLPPWKKILAATTVLAGIVGGAALLFQFLGIHDPAGPPADHILAATVSLSGRDYQNEAVASFILPDTEEASIYLRVENLNAHLIDVKLLPSEGDPITLLHGEEFSTDLNTSGVQYRLPAGEQKISLTSQKASGVLKIYLRLP